MIVPDANLLVYAYDSTSPDHGRARSWWEEVLSGAVPVGVPWVVVLAFTRLMTHPVICANPMTTAQVRGAVELWLGWPQVRLLEARPTTFRLFFDLLEETRAGGNLSTDTLIAALAMEHGGIVYSNDRDFARFPGLVCRNPLEAGS